MRISDWSSDVCSSDLSQRFGARRARSFTTLKAGSPGARSTVHAEQAGIAARRSRVDRQRPFGCEALQIVRTTGLRAGAGQAFTSEWLAADHGADPRAVDVQIADLGDRTNARQGLL